MQTRSLALAVALILAPLGARAADLAVWWNKGFNVEEDAAVREIVAAFEQHSGKQVELSQPGEDDLPGQVAAALEAGQPPDFAFSVLFQDYVAEWAFEDRLVDLSDAVGHFSDMFDPDALATEMLLNAKTGQKALYALPVARSSNHLHVWKSLMERAGFTRADIPREWEAFWSFWCDRVQPAVRQALGRDDIWGVGLPMAAGSTDAYLEFYIFVSAYGADYVTPDGQLVIDDPKIRQRLIKALGSYTAIWRKGCTPPDSVTWDDYDNNKAFLTQAVVLVANPTMSIPNALKRERPDDYYHNSATLEWPLGSQGEPFPIYGETHPAVVFKAGGHTATAKEFVRFLVSEGWLMHYLDFSGERLLPTIPALLDQPFWLDPTDRHRMAAVMQVSSRPTLYNYTAASGNWRHQLVNKELVWSKAIHRVVAEGISPEQAVDEAITRIKQILNE